MIEADLQQAYDQLLQRRANERSAPLISLDLVRELADGRSISQDQVPLLDEVLSHPITRNEFYLLREVARARSRRGWSGVPIWAAVAAVLVLAMGASAFFLRSPLVPELAMLGRALPIALVAPADNDALKSQTRFMWRSANGATTYTLELLDVDGNVVWRYDGGDTTTVAELPPGVVAAAGARYTWIVRASLGDGTTSLSAARTLTAPK